MKLDNLAVVFIGTDKYLKFLPSWYQTCEEKLVPNIPKQYFVFTDGQLEGTPENVSLYKQEHLPWPFITLLRFSTILKAKEELSKYDWLLFLDADMVIVDTIVPSDLFGTKPLIGVHHPCHYLKMNPHGEYQAPLKQMKIQLLLWMKNMTYLFIFKVVYGVVVCLK